MQTIKKWEIKKIRLDEISPCEKNPRTISKAAFSALKESLDKFGYVEPIVWNERTGTIVGGHQRYKALVQKGVEEAMVVIVDFDDDNEIAANITLDNEAITGDWDEPALDLLNEIQANNSDLFSSLRFDDLRNAIDKPISKASMETDDVDYQEEDGEPDTTCPCCGYQWDVTPEDIEMTE